MTNKAKLLVLLSDWKWHSNKEMCDVAGWRFGWYLHVLKKDWVVFEKKWPNENDKDYIEYFRLKYTPMYYFKWDSIRFFHKEKNKAVDKKIKKLVKQTELNMEKQEEVVEIKKETFIKKLFYFLTK